MLLITVNIIFSYVLGLLRIKSITVNFPLKDPHFIALNRTLILEAQVNKASSELVTFLTWDCQNSQGDVRLITNGKTINSRTSVENQGTRLIVKDVTELDLGTYTFTVTDKNGLQNSASVKVLKFGESVLPRNLVMSKLVMSLMTQTTSRPVNF